MQRGSRLFNQLTVPQLGYAKGEKGRNKLLISKRNNYLIYRYYYYAKIKKRTYSDTLITLSNEFFLTERTIADIIQKSSDEIIKVFKEKLNIKQLTEKIYYLNWKNN